MPKKNRKNKSRNSAGRSISELMTNYQTSQPQEPSINSHESSSKSNVDSPMRRILFFCEGVLLQKLRWNGQPTEGHIIKLHIVEKETDTEARTFLEFEHNSVSITSITECSREGYDTFSFLGEPFQQGEDAGWKIIFPQYAVSTCTTFHETLRDRGLRIINRYNSNDENERIVQNEIVPYQLRPVTSYRTNPYPDLHNSTISDLIVQGAHYISDSVMSKAEVVSNIMDTVTPILIQQTPATESPVEVDPGLRTGLNFARSVSDGVATAAESIAIATAAAGGVRRSIFGSVVQEAGTRILAQNYNYTREEAEQTVNTVLQAADGFTEGWGILRQGLFNAAQILGNSFTNNAVKVVEHKYGEEAAEATENTLHIVRNVTSARFNVNIL